jgi:hypothetical protein
MSSDRWNCVNARAGFTKDTSQYPEHYYELDKIWATMPHR